MATETVPLSELTRRMTQVAARTARGDVILSRRGAAEDLYLSTRERHEQESRAAVVTTEMLAVVAQQQPDLAVDALTRTLAWVAWLPSDDKVACLQELLDDLRAGAQTGDLRRFALDLAAWESTAVAHNDPGVLGQLRRPHTREGLPAEASLVERP